MCTLIYIQGVRKIYCYFFMLHHMSPYIETLVFGVMFLRNYVIKPCSDEMKKPFLITCTCVLVELHLNQTIAYWLIPMGISTTGKQLARYAWMKCK